MEREKEEREREGRRERESEGDLVTKRRQLSSHTAHTPPPSPPPALLGACAHLTLSVCVSAGYWEAWR